MRTLSGELTMVGEGIGDFQSRSNQISVIRIGNESVRNLHVTQDISSFLVPGEVREIYLTKLLFRTVIIGLRLRDGRKELLSFGRLLLESIGILLIGGIIALVAGVVMWAILGAILGSWISWLGFVAAFGWLIWQIFRVFQDYALAKAA